MIVPDYWAEAKDKFRSEQGVRTIRRFGWSCDSQSDAEAKAGERLREAMEAAKQGKSILKREPKVPYNGADGLPIREEVIERRGDVVLTRNAYGALCLNTPDVLFADIDVSHPTGCRIYIVVFGITFAALFTIAIRSGVENPFWMVLFASFLVACVGGGLLHRLTNWRQGTPKTRARERVRSFAAKHPDWSMRIYETPNGWRVLVMHKTFDPRGDEVKTFFSEIKSDPLYVRMCFNQNCFRARVSPKPWRIGMDQHILPRPGVWPISPERMNDRIDWVQNYDRLHPSYASCRFVMELGNPRISRRCDEAERVRDWHDRLCQADSELPIA